LEIKYKFMINYTVRWILHHPKRNLLLLILISLPMGYFAGQVNFDYQIMDFFPKSSPQRESYNDFYDAFGRPENEIRVALITDDASIYRGNFLNNTTSLSVAIHEIPGVRKVSSILTEKELAFNRGLPVSAPWIDLQKPENLASDSTRIHNHPLLPGFWVAKNGKSLCLVISPEPDFDDFKRLIQNLQDALDTHGFSNYHVAGVPVGREHFVSKMEGEIVRSGIPAFLFVALLLWLIFKSWKGVVYPLVVIVFTLIWTLGVMGIMGQPINLLTNMLPVIFIVVGVSDAVHFYSGYLEYRRFGLDSTNAARSTLRKIGWATLMTSMTTAVGFLSLMPVPVPVLRNMGLFAAIGVGFAFFITILLFPIFFKTHNTLHLKYKGPDFIGRNLGKLGIHLLKYRKAYSWSPLLLVPILVVGLMALKTDNYFLDDLPPRDSHRVDFEFFESQYGGVRTIDVHVRLGETQFLDYDDFLRWVKLESLICETAPCQNILSPLTPMKSLWNSQLLGPMQLVSREVYDQWWQAHKNILQSKAFGALYNAKENSGRLTIGIPDLGGRKMAALTKAWEGHFQGIFPEWDLNFTGVGWYVDASNQQVVAQLTGGFVMAIVIVALLMGVLFRNMGMVLIAMGINLIPLLITGAAMGFLGLNLRISTAIVFSIVFGIAVDDTIHFLARYRYERLQKMAIKPAILRSIRGTGKAILLTTAILVTGFSTLIFSAFNSIAAIGLLLTIALIAAFVIDVTVLPVWIAVWQGYKTRKWRRGSSKKG
jgi:uncharacterized protein